MSATSLSRRSSLKSPFSPSISRGLAAGSFRANHVRFNLKSEETEGDNKEKENCSGFASASTNQFLSNSSGQHKAEANTISSFRSAASPITSRLNDPVADSASNNWHPIAEVSTDCEAERAMANGSMFRFGVGTASNQASDFSFQHESPFLTAHFLPPSIAESGHSTRLTRRNTLRQDSVQNPTSQNVSMTNAGMDSEINSSIVQGNRRQSGGRSVKFGVPTASLVDSTYRSSRYETGSPTRDAANNSLAFGSTLQHQRPIGSSGYPEPCMPTLDSNVNASFSSSAQNAMACSPAKTVSSPKRFPELVNVSSSRLNAADTSAMSTADVITVLPPAPHSNTYDYQRTETRRSPDRFALPFNRSVLGADTSRWVSVFGYPSEFSEFVFREFSQLGKVEKLVTSRLTSTSHSQTIYIRFADEHAAANAIRRNGALLNCGGSTFRVGVCECSEPVDELANESQATWWQGAADSSVNSGPSEAANRAVSPRRLILDATRSNRSAVRSNNSPAIRNLAIQGRAGGPRGDGTSLLSSSFAAPRDTSFNSSFAAANSSMRFNGNASVNASALLNDSRVRLGKRNASWFLGNGNDQYDDVRGSVPRKKAGFLEKVREYVLGK